MKKLNGNRPKSLLQSAQIAASWLELGIKPVPLSPRSKKPNGGIGWNKLRVTPETVHQFFSDGENVGGLWGDPSNGIIDVDLDWDEASEIAPIFLPETFIYGRSTRPMTHYLYTCPRADTCKYRSSAGEMIIEIRSTGSQSVLPPSIHPDGDRYQIFHDVPIAPISFTQLKICVEKIAAACLFIRHYPDEGGRHDYIHSIAGALLYGGWDEESVNKFLLAILTTVSSQDDDVSGRQYTVRNTIENFKKGNRVYGWKTLSQWMDGKVLNILRGWLIRKYPRDVVPGIVRDLTKESRKHLIFDPKLLHVPGLVGEVMEWSSTKSYIKQPMFDLAVALASVAMATCNKYVVDGWETPLQPYFMLLAPTSAGKESALDSVFGFCRKIGLGEYCFQGFQSYHSLLDTLSEQPHMACWLWDEAARKMRSSSKSVSGPDNQVITWLLSLYGRANSFSPAVPGRHNKIAAVDFPFFSVVAASQPAHLMEALTESDLSTGLINRFILFDAGESFPEANLNRQIIFPSRVEEAVTRIKHVEPPKTDYPFLKVKFDDNNVWNKFREFETEARTLAFNEGVGEMWGRANQNALILAGIVAVGINPRAPRITSQVADWAIQLVRWSCGCWTARLEDSASRTFVEKRSKVVERYIRNCKKYSTKNHYGKKYVSLLNRGFMPKTLLVRLCRHLNTREMDDTVNQLLGADLIATGEVDDMEVYWPKD